jgi:DNA modification methylase
MRPPTFDVLEGDAVEVLRGLPAGIAQTCVTSPPYFGLRDYGEDGQIGLEPTLGEYLARLADVFAEVHRVLRPDGTLWLNLGDSYADDSKWGGASGGKNASGKTGGEGFRRRRQTGIPAKNLIGVPWRVAFALQDAGWILRKAIVWHKPNPTPEAVRDRPTSAHEYIFLFAKQRSYHYDLKGFREPSVSQTPSGNGYKREARIGHDGQGGRESDDRWQLTDSRQARDVWTIPTVPFPDAHFAVFPPELPRRCIALGTSPRACPGCGSPWRRLTERQRLLDGEPVTGSWEGDDTGRRIGAQGVGHWRFTTRVRTLGWHPTCSCGAPAGVRARDLEEVLSPVGQGDDLDPSIEVGRAGLARPRNGEGATRAMTRWEQRHIAAQLAASPDRSTMRDEAGADTFAHYLRTDLSGARAPRAVLLDRWRERGWLPPATPPVPPPWWREEDASRCLVLDPFVGSGTTGRVAIDEGRDFIGVELSPKFARMARERIRDGAAAPRLEMLDLVG